MPTFHADDEPDLTPNEGEITTSTTDLLLRSLTRAKAQAMLDSLTVRETETMEGLAQFKTRKEVARDLDLSEVRIGQLTAAAKKRMGVSQRADAISAFIIARALCEKPIYTEKHLDRGNRVINRIVADHTTEEAFALLSSSEFRQFMQDVRAGGPKALTARFGPWWKYGAGIALAVLIMAALLIAIWLGPALDVLSE